MVNLDKIIDKIGQNYYLDGIIDNLYQSLLDRLIDNITKCVLSDNKRNKR